ncbi:ribonuclease H-like domain-containing protein [Lipomyces japonicus]|uniref:ribonuclease H-like domain-containing protein n=1 Tax=Lipomyces japonicus TaxID=56871 RepID=UPI0034CFF31B
MTAEDSNSLEREDEVQENEEIAYADVPLFIPPSVLSVAAHEIDNSTTYHSPIPQFVSDDAQAPCILGVDEAGRGPVLGPMVYALSYCLKTYGTELKGFGFADSKTLTHDVRVDLLRRICDQHDELNRNVGWATRTMSARDISSGMLRSASSRVYNLNEQAHDATIQLIQETVNRGVNVTEVYVDTVGPPVSYQAKLSKYFPDIKITVSKKADSIYPIVSVASICAKVTRDIGLITRDESGGEWGSGYPSDPRTSKWLRSAIDPVFGWNPVVRFSWQTTKDLLEKMDNPIDVEWDDGQAEFKKPNTGYWFGQTITTEI